MHDRCVKIGGATIVHSISETFTVHHTFGGQIWSDALANPHWKIVWFLSLGGDRMCF